MSSFMQRLPAALRDLVVMRRAGGAPPADRPSTLR